MIYTFDEFVQYGKDNGGNIVNGMPWHFTFHGFPVTHENDNHYLICLPREPHTLHFSRGENIEFDGAALTISPLIGKE